MTRDLDDLLAWLATRMDKTAIARLCRVSWRTVGRACARVVATELDPDRLDGLFRIGVDEISWRKQHKYLTLVVDHDRRRIVWGAEGRDAATLDKFFDELGTERASQIEAVSMDLGPAFLKSVTTPGHAPQAIVCADIFHGVKLVATRSMSCAATSGSNYADYPTAAGPATSKAPDGHSSRTPKTSTTAKPASSPH